MSTFHSWSEAEGTVIVAVGDWFGLLDWFVLSALYHNPRVQFFVSISGCIFTKRNCLLREFWGSEYNKEYNERYYHCKNFLIVQMQSAVSDGNVMSRHNNSLLLLVN